VGEIPIVCYKDTFEIIHASILDERSNKKIVISFKPNVKFLLGYTTDPSKFNNGDYHLISPPTQNFIKYISSTGKKDSLDLTVFDNDPNILYVNNTPSDGNESSFNRFRNANIERKVIKFKDNQNKPNIRIPMSSFCEICSQINKNKKHYRSVIMTGYESGLSVSGDTTVFELGKRWGNTSDVPIGKYSLTIDKNKFLSNINSLADRGIVLFYFDDRKMRMEFPTGYYGTMTIIFDNGLEEQNVESEPETIEQDDSERVSQWFS